MKSHIKILFLLFFLFINGSSTTFATEASPRVRTPIVQKEKKSFKEKLIARWIQKKVEKTQRKENKRKKGKGFPIDATIGLGLSAFATFHAYVILIAPGFFSVLPPSIILALIAAVIAGLLGLISNNRLAKKENPSRTGKVFAKLALILGSVSLAAILILLGIYGFPVL